jgi:septal ring factor EnvC (AmiA/AmiB activator)
VYAIENQINDLQRQINALAARLTQTEASTKGIDERLVNLEKRFGHLFKAFEMLCEKDLKDAQRIVALEVHSDFLRLDSQRWDEVYYNVFPERLRQDVKLQKQLHSLERPAKPEDEEPKG